MRAPNEIKKEIDLATAEIKIIQESDLPHETKAQLIKNWTHLITHLRYMERKEKQGFELKWVRKAYL
jgi:hypothetical protein